MALSHKRGKDGEILAQRYLEEHGFEICCCNWRSGRYEIDIIAIRDDVLHFIEVKTRHSLQFGYPEESVTRKKFSHIARAAAHYIGMYARHMHVQYDILSILRLPGKEAEYLMIEDVYM